MKRLKIELKPDSKLPLARQLYDEIRRQVICGELTAGSKLPSSRQLADQMGLARGTVIVAYQRLTADGYTEARHGSATRVSHHLPQSSPQKPVTSRRRQNIPTQIKMARLSNFGKALLDIDAQPAYPEAEIGFYFWRPDLDSVPMKQLIALLARRTRAADPALFDYQSDPLGYRPLRDAIARYLHRARGIKCSAEQIAVVAGWKQSLDIVARLHVERGDLVAVENPCYPSIRDVFSHQGALIYPVPVDDQGMDVAQLMRADSERFRLVYVSPSHQLPTGCVLSLKRRMELLSWAASTGTIIFEDEHDSEYCYTGSPILPLKAIDEDDRIIMQGTFHKVLFPGLAVSYLVLPEYLTGIYSRALSAVSEPVPAILQATLADFIREGYLRRHMRKMRERYASRRLALLNSLHKHFGNALPVSGDSTGMHVTVRFQCRLSDAQLIQKALAAGVGLPSTRDYYAGPAQKGEFMLGYACLTEKQIAEGVARLAKIIKANT